MRIVAQSLPVRIIMRNMVDTASGSWLFREGEMRMDADTTRSAPIANGLFTWPSEAILDGEAP